MGQLASAAHGLGSEVGLDPHTRLIAVAGTWKAKFRPGAQIVPEKRFSPCEVHFPLRLLTSGAYRLWGPQKLICRAELERNVVFLLLR